MSRLRLTSSQWIERHRRGLAVEVEVAIPDVRRAVVDGRLDAEDLARVLTGFRGQPSGLMAAMRYERPVADGDLSAYVLDEESGMVYLLD